jgi:hypothetical protein
MTDFEKIQKINDLARQLRQHGLVSTTSEAIKMAEDMISRQSGIVTDKTGFTPKESVDLDNVDDKIVDIYYDDGSDLGDDGVEIEFDESDNVDNFSDSDSIYDDDIVDKMRFEKKAEAKEEDMRYDGLVGKKQVDLSDDSELKVDDSILNEIMNEPDLPDDLDSGKEVYEQVLDSREKPSDDEKKITKLDFDDIV